ncbi:MAG: hypothetical protein BECKG1743D_GA0114223_104081 [Candidatus Kentron sp. G]|nr:MAG: hypothetical protein BECKG1743F_GA0114225_103831 [Candidatus Kentron sp. G]VFN01245.1 MAG: hypothetical protein BECKG1743E_GA0114224_103931 [Candidatus Kentron sp. G]VFN02889.1 MAG: hypothetical protein BECKG1743D_GA0114223_104081 [Candidatus Kentron sp. G]
MNNRLVFNHHSLPFPSAAQADAAIPAFLRLALKARHSGFSVVLVDERIDASWFRIKLSEGYFWQDWHNRYSDGNSDSILAFRDITTRQPLFTADEKKRITLFEVHLPDSSEPLIALQAANHHEAPLLSFPTRLPWTQSPVVAIMERLTDDEEMESIRIEIHNLYDSGDPGNLAVLETMRQEQSDNIRRGRELHANLDNLYPALGFCSKSRRQLASWSQAPTLLKKVKEAFSVLNDLSEDWEKENMAGYTHQQLRQSGMDVSSESDSVAQNSKLRRHREFRLPTGEKVFFENHVKLGDYRIHFYPDPGARKIFIGYVGPHLPTAKS